jgi:hypothetical protein
MATQYGIYLRLGSSGKIKLHNMEEAELKTLASLLDRFYEGYMMSSQTWITAEIVNEDIQTSGGVAETNDVGGYQITRRKGRCQMEAVVADLKTLPKMFAEMEGVIEELDRQLVAKKQA